MEITFYGLLHLAEHERSAINIDIKSFAQQKNIYLKNAINLSRSLKRQNVPFILLTNRQQEIYEELEKIGCKDELIVEEITFSTKVPNGIKFYSAHFKLDVFHYLSSMKSSQYVGLLDLDMFALGEVPLCLKSLIEKNVPIIYDISDQVIPAYGGDRILQDMQKLLPNIEAVRWCGGEFIAGTPNFFSLLRVEIGKIYGSYVEVIDTLHHQGDEALTSVAVEKLRRDGHYIVDGGTRGIVGRFWSIPTMHSQQPFDRFKRCFLLHLPGDKDFLGKFNAKNNQNRDYFLKQYGSYLVKRFWKRKLLAWKHKLSRFLSLVFSGI